MLEKGDYFFNKTVNDSAVFYYEAGFKDCKNCNTVLMANYYLKLGEPSTPVGEKLTALECPPTRNICWRSHNDYDGLMNANVYLAEFYRYINNIEKAYFYIEEARKINLEYQVRKITLAHYYNRRAAIVSLKFDDKQLVIDLSKKSIEIANEIKDYKLLIYSYNEIAFAYESLNNTSLAFNYYLKSLQLAEEHQFTIELCDVLFNVCRLEYRAADKKLTGPAHNYPDRKSVV